MKVAEGGSIFRLVSVFKVQGFTVEGLVLRDLGVVLQVFLQEGPFTKHFLMRRSDSKRNSPLTQTLSPLALLTNWGTGNFQSHRIKAGQASPYAFTPDPYSLGFRV